MCNKLSAFFGSPVPSQTLRVVAGLGLVLSLTFAGSARADDVEFGFAAVAVNGHLWLPLSYQYAPGRGKKQYLTNLVK